ncbi:Uncharacterised protein [Bordetella pertussis]|nr:Uncharacterised protein [Bordetella pertussis]
MDAGAMALLGRGGEHAQGLAAGLPQRLQIRQQVGAAHGLAEMDFNHDLASGIGLFLVVGVRVGGRRGRRGTRCGAAHAGLTARRARRRAILRAGAKQGILLGRREMGLHPAAHPAVLPPVKAQHQQYEQDTKGNQPDLQITHENIPRLRQRKSEYGFQASAAICTAESISTATIRDTPCSCIVTPISCLAICMAILLCEMNRNWVCSLMLLTRLA